MDKKTKYTLAGILFLVCGGSRLYSYVRFAMACLDFGDTGFLYPMNLISPICGVIAVILGIVALNGKDRSKTLDVLAIIYILYAVYGFVNSLRNSFPVKSLGWIAAFAVAYFLTMTANSVVSTKDSTSQAAQNQVQTEKQESIYDQQLCSGILTQEEYDQITGKK